MYISLWDGLIMSHSHSKVSKRKYEVANFFSLSWSLRDYDLQLVSPFPLTFPLSIGPCSYEVF